MKLKGKAQEGKKEKLVLDKWKETKNKKKRKDRGKEEKKGSENKKDEDEILPSVQSFTEKLFDLNRFLLFKIPSLKS